MKKIIHFISGCLIAVAAVAADSSTSQVFQMRLVLENPSSETDQMTLVRKGQGADQKEVLFVQKTVLLDETDLKSAEVSTNLPNGTIDNLLKAKGAERVQTVQIDIVFTDKGAKRLAEITRKNIGKRLAIVIGGQLYCAPKILSELSDGKARIVGDFSQQEAREIVAKITESLQKR